MIVPHWVYEDREWASALYVLTDRMLEHKSIARYIDFDRQRIDFQSLNKEAAEMWSSTQQAFLKLAQHLFSGNGQIDLIELIGKLDDERWDRVVTALEIRRGRATVRSFQ